jgi:hypothetical protein
MFVVFYVFDIDSTSCIDSTESEYIGKDLLNLDEQFLLWHALIES